ncbi:MAG: mannitol dehydrogenase family protein [Candidatus Symbiothrix sp.]|jgi:mannitol 2-dehydrogenase|nr:mannitol dehydrogenase family protein [Candidatus Symbiothrix sp.]
MKKIIHYNYNRNDVKAGILHIGVGNFHRSHEEFYINQLLADKSQQNWGICGVMLLPGDEKLYRKLKKQDGIYTLTVCGRDGRDEVYEIGSLVDLAWAIESPEAVLNKIADKDIKIITLTITEGGYNIEKATGAFILDSEDIRLEINNPGKELKTVFGYVAEGLRRRKSSNNEPVTILSCDNLQHNGDTARKAFMTFIEAQDKDLYEWAKENVSFPNSMVDRITPATLPDDIDRLNREHGTNDEAPVYSEDFIQWVVEDKFVAGRPAWEKAGVEFTDDVTAYEYMKLSLLNASHIAIAFPAFLSGYRMVVDAMNDKRIVKFMKDLMDKDVTRYVPVPPNTDIELYKKTLVERFSNRSVGDQVERLCSDVLSKFPVFIMPNFIKMINDHADITRIAYWIAVYRHYLKYKTDDNGATFTITEPWMSEEDNALINSDDPVLFLNISAFRSIDLKQADYFVEKYLQMVESVKTKGAMAVLETIIV